MFWEIPNSQYPQKINLGISQIPKLGILEFWEFGNLGILGIWEFWEFRNFKIPKIPKFPNREFQFQIWEFFFWEFGNLGILKFQNSQFWEIPNRWEFPKLGISQYPCFPGYRLSRFFRLRLFMYNPCVHSIMAAVMANGLYP